MRTSKSNCPDGSTRVIGYIRVSTQKQVDSGLGIAAQERQLREDCERRGWCLLELVSDSGRSAKTMSRDGLLRALDMLRKKEAEVLMVSKSDRATRSVRDLYELMDASAREGWSLVDLETEVDTADPTGRMIAGMRGVVSQWEREIIGKRTREALAEKKAQGVRLGRPAIVPLASVQRVRDLRAEGLSVRAIAERLNAEGVSTAGGGRWYATTVQRLLEDPNRSETHI